jgi:hypothetical protein
MSQPAGLDVRWPLGLLFAMIGALLLGYGLTHDDAVTAGDQAIHINAWWGGVLLIFGITVLWLARRGSRKTPFGRLKG